MKRKTMLTVWIALMLAWTLTFTGFAAADGETVSTIPRTA